DENSFHLFSLIMTALRRERSPHATRSHAPFGGSQGAFLAEHDVWRYRYSTRQSSEILIPINPIQEMLAHQARLPACGDHPVRPLRPGAAGNKLSLAMGSARPRDACVAAWPVACGETAALSVGDGRNRAKRHDGDGNGAGAADLRLRQSAA